MLRLGLRRKLKSLAEGKFFFGWPGSLPRLRRKLKTAKFIYFVCRGNKYRSPFAAQYARMILPVSVRVESAAYDGPAGDSCPASAIDTARTFGIDLARHVSAEFSPDFLEEADAVFVFEPEHLNWMVKNHARFKEKVFILGLLQSGWSCKLGDHTGPNILEVTRVYSRITDCLDKVRAKVTG